MKKICRTGMLIVLMLLMAAPLQVQAASKKYVKLYRTLLETGKRTVHTAVGSYDIKFVSFRLLDINRDKTPELIIKNTEPDKSFSTVMVYTVKKGKLVYCGEYYTKTFSDLLYSKKDKGIRDEWWTNGVGGYGYVTWGLNSKKKVAAKRWAWSGAESYGGTKLIYKKGVKEKKTTKSKYNKYVKKYFAKKRFKTYHFLKNTAANRAAIK